MSLVKAYANEDVTVTVSGPLNAAGYRPKTGVATSMKAWVIDTTKDKWTPSGVETVYDKAFLIPGNETVAVGYQIAHNSINHEVVRVDTKRGVDNVTDHYKVFVRVLA